jgi:hypothetical protein
MTFGELLFWIIVAIIAYFLLKVGLAILIIAIILVVIYYIINSFATHSSQPFNNINYEEFYIYPNLPCDPDQFGYDMEQKEAIGRMPMGYDNYWYIPIHDYFDEKQNGPAVCVPSTCDIPQSISEFCVNKHMQHFGDLDMAISKCTIPPKTSASCAH